MDTPLKNVRRELQEATSRALQLVERGGSRPCIMLDPWMGDLVPQVKNVLGRIPLPTGEGGPRQRAG